MQLPQARKKPTGFPEADLHTSSKDWKDAALRSNGGGAQKADFAQSSDRLTFRRTLALSQAILPSIAVSHEKAEYRYGLGAGARPAPCSRPLEELPEQPTETDEAEG